MPVFFRSRDQQFEQGQVRFNFVFKQDRDKVEGVLLDVV